MRRTMATLCLAVAVLAVFADSAAAHLGKGEHVGKGAIVLEKPSLSFTTACQEKCHNKCTLVPNQVCAEVAVPYKECAKVPITKTIQKCKKVCTAVESQPVVETTAVAYGKGKGRHLLGKGLPILGKGKGMGVQISCDHVCQDIPITTFTVQCATVTRTVNKCKKTLEKACSPVCHQYCKKVPVLTKEAVVIPTGKGKGFIGKGH